MNGYSLDLRRRIVAAVECGMARQEIVTTFGISLGTIKCLLAKQRRGADLALGRPTGRTPTITPAQYPTLRAQLDAYPDATFLEHAERWNAAYGTDLSQWMLGRAIRRSGWTRKKTLAASERDEAARAAFRQRLAERPAADFVVVDEMGSNLNLTPRYGRAPRGQRAVDQVPRNTPVNTTLIAACTLDGMGPALLVEGTTDTAAFVVYIEQVLAPTLRPGQVVVLDNLSAHKSPKVAQAIATRGCEVWYLPSYSPDLSPIEEAFAKLKTLLRKAKARTREALEAAIATLLERITSADLHGFFTHSGYRLRSVVDQ